MRKLNPLYIIPFLWALIILVLSLMPGKDMPSFSIWDIINSDKIAHFGFYGVQVYLLIRSMNLSNLERNHNKQMIWAFVSVLVYGGLIEIMQGTLCPDRYADIFDFIANGIGAGLGVFIYRIYPKLGDFCFNWIKK